MTEKNIEIQEEVEEGQYDAIRNLQLDDRSIVEGKAYSQQIGDEFALCILRDDEYETGEIPENKGAWFENDDEYEFEQELGKGNYLFYFLAPREQEVKLEYEVKSL